MPGRSKICRQILKEKGLSALLVSDFYNVGYLSGFFPLTPSEREVFLLLTKNKLFLLTDGRYINQAKAQKTGFTCLEAEKRQSFFQTIASLCRKLKIQKLAFEKENLTVAEYKKLKRTVRPCRLFPTQHIVEEKRAVKDSYEMVLVKKACQIADQAFEHLLGFLKPGLSEKEVADEIEWFVRKKGAACPERSRRGDLSFDPIVASGENSAFPHHRSGTRKLGRKDIVLLDLGAKVEGYCSDMTRVVFLGKATAEQRKVYGAVQESQQKALEYLTRQCHSERSEESRSFGLRPQDDMKAKDIDKVARGYVTSHGYPTIPHGLGHGVGLSEHESPRLSPKSKDILKPGMVFSLEPGIYLKNFGGIRIEDLVVLEKNGPQILTKSPKKIIEL